MRSKQEKPLTVYTPVEAESFFMKAEGILGDLRELGGVSPEERTETEFEISTNLSRYLNTDMPKVYQEQIHNYNHTHVCVCLCVCEI